MPKRTLHRKKNRKQLRVHGFRSRMRSASGRNVLKSRRKKGRKELTVSVHI